MFLARKEFSDRIISISPALPGNMLQIDTLRLKIFGSTLLTGKPFRFTSEIAKQHLMANIDPDVVAETSKYFVDEPASLIWEYALMKKYTKLSREDLDHLKNNVKGLIITGTEDRMCSATKQKDLSKMLGFEQIEIQCRHTPQLGPHHGKILDGIMQFIANHQELPKGKAS